MLTEAQLRGVLQLPARPYSENILYTSDRYYDLTHFEPLTIYSLTGMNGAFSSYAFSNGVDFVLNNGVVDFGIGGSTPTLGTPFTVNYSYSTLGANTVSTSMWIASTTVHQQLASSFPYSASSPSGVAYQDLATLGTLMVAAREACAAMSSSEVENAIKYRRGGIQMDETLKTKSWSDLARSWDEKYQKYLALIRPTGNLSRIQGIAASARQLVFPSDGAVYPDYAYLAQDEYGSYGGIL